MKIEMNEYTSKAIRVVAVCVALSLILFGSRVQIEKTRRAEFEKEWRIKNMLKKIDVPENCCSIVFFDKMGDQISMTYKDDLEDCTETPRTADGLTLPEFAFKAKRDCSNVQVKIDNKWHQVEASRPADANDCLYCLIYNLTRTSSWIKDYRIKPEGWQNEK